MADVAEVINEELREGGGQLSDPEAADNTVRVCMAAGDRERHAASSVHSDRKGTPRLALAELVAIIFSINAEFSGGAISKINRDKCRPE